MNDIQESPVTSILQLIDKTLKRKLYLKALEYANELTKKGNNKHDKYYYAQQAAKVYNVDRTVLSSMMESEETVDESKKIVYDGKVPSFKDFFIESEEKKKKAKEKPSEEKLSGKEEEIIIDPDV